MDSVWVVKQGKSIDCHVVGIYGSEKDAEKVKDTINSSDSEYVLAYVDEHKLGEYLDVLDSSVYYVFMYRNGTIRECVSIGWRVINTYSTLMLRDLKALSGCVYARDEGHAIKIANEKRAQLIAMCEWPEEG